GGAGKVAALKLAQSGVKELFLVNRTESKLGPITELLRERFPGTTAQMGYPKSPVDLVVNATSLGLQPSDPLPYDAGRWSPAGVAHAYDMIYQPAETPFLRQMREAGARTANGLGMLLHQGAKALEIWSGRSAPLAAMRQALVTQIYNAGMTPSALE
ncbi:MAG: shikimate dehydrogenase, partial [Verrucomicrobiales bacterium]